MSKGLLYSSLAAAALTALLAAPSLAQAQARCQEQKHDNRVIGTVLGAVGGAFLGNAIGQHGGKEGGTIIGGVGGAVAGNAIGGATVNCNSNQYGYYDDNGRWVPNTVSENGYYDANGRWVETRPEAPPPTYADPPPAYGQANGYPPPAASGQDNGYPPPPPPPSDSYSYGQARPYEGDNGYQRSDSRSYDTREREDRLQARIQQQIADGRLDDRRGRHALRDLDDIRRMDADYRDADGHLNGDQRRDIEERLDTLRASLWADRDQADARDQD